MILQIETATTVCSVALANEGKIQAVKQLNERNVHAEVITLFIQDVLNEAGVRYEDLQAIAVSCGPGSYTGLRIGVSTAKGLCFALDKPLIAIETLESMAYGVIAGKQYSDILLCPMIDARRMEVYTALYDLEGNQLEAVTAKIISEDSFADQLAKHRILFFGDGAGKCEAALGQSANALFMPDFVNSAVHLTQKAFEKYHHGQFEDVAYFEPHYLKEFIPGVKKQV
jgi:tRNA threonylcarbamoyladenosine biosynthesis protein TsaB